MTGCFINLPLQFPNILDTNGKNETGKLETTQTLLDGIEMSGHACKT